MLKFIPTTAAMFALSVLLAAAEQPVKPAAKSVSATIETSLTAATKIPQFAFDGQPNSYFESEKNPGKADHFTLVFDVAVSVKSVTVTTGTPNNANALEMGVLEGSADGKEFVELAKFADGSARATPNRSLKAIRVKASGDLAHPLAIREIAIDSEPVVAIFRYPVMIVGDTSDAPELKDWLNKTTRVCERQYAMICDELPSEGYKPPTVIRMTLKNDYKGVAAAGGTRITGSVKYFKDHPDDIGAMVHETVHCVQAYPGGKGNPGWLVEGIADYIRFFKYEANKPKPLAPERAQYDGSYRVTAAFLFFLVEKHDKEIVKKLNVAMRQGKYTDGIWKELTGKTVEELGRDWKASLAK